MKTGSHGKWSVTLDDWMGSDNVPFNKVKVRTAFTGMKNLN